MRITLLCLLCMILGASGPCAQTKGGGEPVIKKLTSFEVEIAPGKWLELQWNPKEAAHIFQWKGVNVIWALELNSLKTGLSELPITIREKNDELFLISLDRKEPTKAKFVYFKLNPATGKIERITSKAFPKDIATQNLSLNGMNQAIGKDGKRIDELKILQELDVKNIYFIHQFTACLWLCLELGKEYSEIKEQYDPDKIGVMAADYAAKYHPVALKDLRRIKG